MFGDHTHQTRIANSSKVRISHAKYVCYAHERKTTRINQAPKKFFPTLLITIFLWGIIASVVYFIDPQVSGIIPLFFLLIFTTLLFTFSMIFANTRRGFLVALSSTFFLLLRYFGVGNILNLLLIVGVMITVELYSSRR